MMTKIKICGLKTVEDVLMANRQRPDFVGFVFAGYKRKITPEQAMEMKQFLLPEIRSVGVYINEDISHVAHMAETGVLDLIQLHGDEAASYIRQLKDRTDKPVIKAVRVRSSEDILAAQELPCDYLLLDTFKADEYGGSGITFDWALIPKLEKPYFLAGGIGVENVEQVIREFHPYAVDVSSSVETDGRKDEEKVWQLIQKVRLMR